MITKPKTDIKEIQKAVEILYPPDVIVELRAFHKKRKRTDAGYFDGDNREALAKAAAKLNDQYAVYVTLNPVDQQLISRYANRIEDYADSTTTDNNIISRRWLLIDVDPVRPKKTPATDAQLSQAKDTTQAIFKHLQQAGWADPVTADSGNGVHLLYRIDLPNDKVSCDLIKGVLQTLAQQFDTPTISVDQSVFNAGRIVKLYGTVANKGDHTDAAPYRLSRITYVPDNIDIVTLDQLQALVPPAQIQPSHQQQQSTVTSPFDFDGFMGRLGIDYQLDHHSGRERYKLEHCPFNSDHGRGEAAIFRELNGRLGFKCQHNSCADKGWKDVRTLVDGDRSKTITMSSPSEWFPPEKIPSVTLKPVLPFDIELMPEALRGWVSDITERMQCPPDFVGVGAMVAVSSAIGRKAVIRPKRRDDWTVVPNLWGGVVGRPGIMKSPALSEATKPLDRLQAEATEQYLSEREEFIKNQELAEIAGDAAKARARTAAKKGNMVAAAEALESRAQGSEVVSPPILRRHKVTDSSVEALGEILIENPWGVLVYRDEINGLLRGLDKEGQEGARSFYLQGYDGNQDYTFDRIGRGKYLRVPAVCIALLGGIQPGKLQSYVRDAMSGGSGDDGLLQRFSMMVWPDINPEWRNVDRYPDKEAKNQAFEVFKRLDALTPDEGETFEPVPRVLSFDDTAQDIFDEWRCQFERDLRSSERCAAMESHLAKYRKLVPAIALVCALADGREIVAEDDVLRALAWAEYLQTHAERIYSSGEIRPEEAAKKLLEKIKAGKVESDFTQRDIHRKGWSGLDVEETASGVELLCELGYLREIPVIVTATGGRPSARYQINPLILGVES